jgi:hypothetical protein
VGETLRVVENLGVESNPFDAVDGGGRLGRPLQQALGEVIRQIGFQMPVVVVSGSAGTGKTLLAKIAKRACADLGLSVRRVQRSDFKDIAGEQRCDVLLVDEADSLPDSTLHTLLLEGNKRPATTAVLLCLPDSVPRLAARGNAVVVELTRLSQSDTRQYLQERATHAGFPDLFTPVAFDLLVDGSRGVPRWLWSIAGLAYFYAAAAGASQIGLNHVARALASIAPPEMPEAVPTAPSVKSVAEPPVSIPVPNPQRTSERVASFKRGGSAEPTTPQMFRPERQEASGRSTLAADTPIGTILRGLDPIPPSELPASMAAVPGRAADGRKVESAREPQAAGIGLAHAPAATKKNAPRDLSFIVGPAAGIAIAVAATIALTVFMQPASRNEKAATGAENIPVTAPAVVHQPSATPARPSSAPRQAAGKPGVENKTARLSNPSGSVANPSSVLPKAATLKATQPTGRTKPVRLPESDAPPAPATPLNTSVATAMPMQVEAVTGNGNPANPLDAEAEATITAEIAAIQQQDERDRLAKDAAAQVDAAIREAEAKDAANRATALARAAALAAQKEKEREKRTSDFKPRWRLY